MKKKKHDAFLKFIIGYKAFMGVVELILSVSFYKYLGGDLQTSFTALAINLNLDTDNQIISSAIKKAGMIESGTLLGITSAVFIIGVVNLVEAAGLHYRQRWAEWLTVFATGAFIPFELYEVLEDVSLLKIVILVLNIAIVYYLAKHKELFKKKRKGPAN